MGVRGRDSALWWWRIVVEGKTKNEIGYINNDECFWPRIRKSRNDAANPPLRIIQGTAGIASIHVPQLVTLLRGMRHIENIICIHIIILRSPMDNHIHTMHIRTAAPTQNN